MSENRYRCAELLALTALENSRINKRCNEEPRKSPPFCPFDKHKFHLAVI
jgi:hypothetical protein